MKCKDKRIRAMYEILNSIKIIKYNAWEEIFGKKARTDLTKNISRIICLRIDYFFGGGAVKSPKAYFCTQDPKNDIPNMLGFLKVSK